MNGTFLVGIEAPPIKDGIWKGICYECGILITAHNLIELNENSKFHHDNKHKTATQSETIAEEASRIVYGDREQAYDDPNLNFNKLAHMWTGHLLKKLQPGQTITASDVAIMQVMLKISREGFRPKRDNRVDMIGYTLCLDRIEEAKDAK